MDFQRTDFVLKTPVRSLCWSGETLMDWAGGNRVIDLRDGSSRSEVNWGYRFDAAASSPSGRYAVIYERFGTKAVLMERGKFIRELNRSFYCADDYEYPIVFAVHPDGRELIAHCPDEYNQIELDDVATGERLTKGVDRKPSDTFHSRLATSPDQRRLLSAGWIWHPVNVVSIWSIADVLKDARLLDTTLEPGGADVGAEVSDATFIDSDRLLMSSESYTENFGGNDEARFLAGTAGAVDLHTGKFETIVKTEERVGPMLWLGNDRFVGFHETPRVFNLRTGGIEHRWPDVATGKRNGSIVLHNDPLPTIALDAARRRFAVALGDRLTVISFSD